MQGWVKLYRKFTEWEWYGNPTVKIVFLDLLLNANHIDGKWQGKEIKRGQLITSVSKIANRNGLSVQQVRTALNKLKETGEIQLTSTNRSTLVNVLNYAKFQGVFDTEQQTNNKQITNNQQTNNNQITTNKNVKNIKNDKNVRRETKKTEFNYNIGFVSPTLEEIKKYILSNSLNVCGEDFFDYYTANGWTVKGTPMRNWQAMCRKWSRCESKQKKSQITNPPTFNLEKIKQDSLNNTEIKY